MERIKTLAIHPPPAYGEEVEFLPTNVKKQCLLNACKHSNVNLDELLKTYKIPYQYTNENKDELFFETKPTIF